MKRPLQLRQAQSPLVLEHTKIYAGALSWIEEVMADLRYNLRRLDSESQRRVMRTYGATFAYLDGKRLTLMIRWRM